MAVGEDYRTRLAEARVHYQSLTAMTGRAKTLAFTFNGIDLTSATFRGAVRILPNAGGAALADWAFDAEFVGGDTVVLATLAAGALDAPPAIEPGGSAQLYYDLTIEPSGGDEVTFMAGEIFRAGSVVL